MKKCANHYAVAVDLGASGGKMAAASFDGGLHHVSQPAGANS